MKKLSKEDLTQEIYDLYDYYVHNRIERRTFMDQLSTYAVGGVTVPALLKLIMPNYKDNIQVPLDDPTLNTETITYKSPNGGGDMDAQISRPKEVSEKLPGIVVVHENRGLNPYIADVGRRAAKSNFISIAPDALTPLGGYPGNDDEGRTMQRKRDRGKMLEDFISAFEYLRSHPECNGHIGVVGFCFGGWISNMMAVKVPELKGAVPFYGGQPKEDIEKINAPLLLHFGGLDERVNKGWPAYEEALKKHGKRYQAHFYENANHGFHNDTTPRFKRDAAELAWKRTISFFEESLKA